MSYLWIFITLSGPLSYQKSTASYLTNKVSSIILHKVVTNLEHSAFITL